MTPSMTFIGMIFQKDPTLMWFEKDWETELLVGDFGVSWRMDKF